MTDTMVVTINGDDVELALGATVDEILDDFVASRRGIAVAVNREVVSRSKWTTTVIVPGSSIEIVTAAAGG